MTSPGPRDHGFPSVSDAGLIPPDLADAAWEQHFLTYFAAIRAELADSERPLRTVTRRGEIWGHEIASPLGPLHRTRRTPPGT